MFVCRILPQLRLTITDLMKLVKTSVHTVRFMERDSPVDSQISTQPDLTKNPVKLPDSHHQLSSPTELPNHTVNVYVVHNEALCDTCGYC